MAADGSVIIEAVLDTSKVEKGVKDVNSTLDGVSWKGIKEGDAAAQKLSGSLKSAGTAATVGLTAPIVAAGTAAFTTASSYEQATARIQSALGLTAEEAEHLGDVGEGIYENGFGQSLDLVSDALITVRQNLGDLNDQDLEYVTQAALTLSDTLGMDVGESVRGVNALMDGFGMSAQDAMDLFAAGAQDGLNYSDELGDNLAEYGPRFAQMGFSAQEYFSILKAGTENGAYNLDKVNDFLNEFQTSLVDGRMDESIGRFSESTQQLFEAWKTGGATGQQVFEAVLGELAKMPDGYDKANLASTLWSSLGEDNAMGMITSLAGVENKYGDVTGAAGEAADAASDSFGVKAQTAMRELQGAIEPLGEPLLNIATNVAGAVQSFGEWFAGIGEGGQMAVLAIAGILAAIGHVLSVAGNLVEVIPAIAAALSGAGGAAGLFGGALAALTGPVGIVIGVVAGLVAAITYLWNTNEGFRTAVTEAWNAIWGTIQGIMSGITGIISGAWNVVVGVVGGAINGVVSTVQNGLNTALSVVQGIFSGIESAVSNAMNGAKNVVSSVISAIKGFFNFRVSWPHIPLPHIHYDLINVPLLGDIPNPATLSVSWYAKGGVFNGPSVIGVGEAGPEGVVPFNKRGAEPLAEGIADRLEQLGKGGDEETAVLVRQLIRELPGIIRKNSARSIVWNEREVARLIWKVSQ